MKAKDYLKEKLFEDVELWTEKPPFERTELLSSIMIKFAKINCKEQRNICQKIFDCTDAQIGDVFTNAPEPDFQ